MLNTAHCPRLKLAKPRLAYNTQTTPSNTASLTCDARENIIKTTHKHDDIPTMTATTRIMGGWRRLRHYSHSSGKFFASPSQSSPWLPLSSGIPSSAEIQKERRHSLSSTSAAGIALPVRSDFRQCPTVLPLAQRKSHQIRRQSDSLKQRAVEALKSKTNDDVPVRRPAASNGSNAGSSSKSENGPSGSVSGSSSAGKSVGRGVGKGDDDFGDVRPSSGVAAATASSHRASRAESANDKTTETTNIVEKSGIGINESEADADAEVASDVSSNSDSNPWAHMHLHEFAPKIVVVGVGGAGTNAVNNMVASGLSGKISFLLFPS